MTKLKPIPKCGPLFFSVLATAVLLLATFVGWQTWVTMDRQRTLQRLVANLSSTDAAVRRNALHELRVINVDYGPVLIELVRHDDPQLRRFACVDLGSFRPLKKSALVPLTNALSDKDAMVRCDAAHAIGEYGTNATQSLNQAESSAVSRLCRALSDKNVSVREAAAFALGEFGTRSELTIPALKSALGDDNANVRLRAAWSLYEIDHNNSPLMILVIEEVMAGDDAAAHDFVAGIVGALGETANEIMPQIVKDVNAK